MGGGEALTTRTEEALATGPAHVATTAADGAIPSRAALALPQLRIIGQT
jgi:hypothetical protein